MYVTANLSNLELKAKFQIKFPIVFIDLNCFLRWAMWPMGLLLYFCYLNYFVLVYLFCKFWYIHYSIIWIHATLHYAIKRKTENPHIFFSKNSLTWVQMFIFQFILVEYYTTNGIVSFIPAMENVTFNREFQCILWKLSF